MEQLHAAADGCEWIAEFMGEPRRELADGRKPLADPGPFLQGLDVREVLKQQQLSGLTS